MNRLLTAIAFAAHKHSDQRRKDFVASPYINHPIRLANLLANEAGIEDERVRWGLIPSWAKDPSIGNKLNNARGETVPAVYIREQPLSVCARQGEHLARGGWKVQLGNHVG